MRTLTILLLTLFAALQNSAHAEDSSVRSLYFFVKRDLLASEWIRSAQEHTKPEIIWLESCFDSNDIYGDDDNWRRTEIAELAFQVVNIKSNLKPFIHQRYWRPLLISYESEGLKILARHSEPSFKADQDEISDLTSRMYLEISAKINATNKKTGAGWPQIAAAAEGCGAGEFYVTFKLKGNDKIEYIRSLYYDLCSLEDKKIPQIYCTWTQNSGETVSLSGEYKVRIKNSNKEPVTILTDQYYESDGIIDIY